MMSIDEWIAEFNRNKTFKKLQKIYHNVICNHCKNGNFQAIKDILEKNPLLKRQMPETFITTVCKYEHINILEYFMNYFDYIDLNTQEGNIFNYCCRMNKINTIKNIIKITGKNKLVIDFNINEYRRNGVENGGYIGTIITQIENPIIISYLESCGAKPINKKLIV